MEDRGNTLTEKVEVDRVTLETEGFTELSSI